MGLALSLIDEDASAAGFAGATTAATMMAIVHRRYGRPDVLEAIAEMWSAVGVQPNLESLDPGAYVTKQRAPRRTSSGVARPRTRCWSAR